jgi:hypothetical protein
MGYVLKRNVGREEAQRVELYYDASGLPVSGPERAAGSVVFYLRRLKGRDLQRINDTMVEADRDGRTVIKSGSVTREKILCSVLAVEGLEDESGNPVSRITPEVYDALDAWMIDALLEAVNRLNEFEAPEGE